MCECVFRCHRGPPGKPAAAGEKWRRGNGDGTFSPKRVVTFWRILFLCFFVFSQLGGGNWEREGKGETIGQEGGEKGKREEKEI